MKAVILAGGCSFKLYPLTKNTPKAMLSVANKPLLEYLLLHLKNQGIKEIIIASGSANGKFIDYFGYGKKWGVNITYCIEPYPLGTAGCLRNVRHYLDSGSFMVINGCALTEVNIDSMISSHMESNACATIGQIQDKTFPSAAFLPAGIYMFKQQVFNFIPIRGNFDIKDQLIPVLKKRKYPVHYFQLNGYWNNLFTVTDYIRANCDILRDKLMASKNNRLGNTSKIEFDATPFKSVLTGNNCNIHESAKLIGPLAIGDNCNIEEGVTINKCIVGPGVHFKKGASVNNCVIGRKCCIPHNTNISDAVFLKGVNTVGSLNIAMTNLRKHALSIAFGKCSSFLRILNIMRLKLYRIIRRTVDICVSLIGLLLSMPLFALVSLLIKLDSKGPVFFVDRRMMNDRKNFGMIKFRSMVVESEKMQKQLIPLTDTDGPMFKMENDPRFTRIGKFISRIKLDELPQLINVLKGQMSLVGPRPLAENQMKYNPYWKEARLMVKQGITGLWQVRREQAAFHTWIENDIFYVENQSFYLDMKILFMTAVLVITKIGQAVKDLPFKFIKRETVPGNF